MTITGNTYSKEHEKYSSNDKEFWNFTLDDMVYI